MAQLAVSGRRLVNVYETNQKIKILGRWLILKHLSKPGILKEWNSQKDYILKLCKCSDASFRKSLTALKEINLISFTKINRKRDTINVCSWQQLASILNINVKERSQPIKININDKQKIDFWIIATEIKHNQNCQDKAISKKLGVNAEVKRSIDTELIKFGADVKRLTNLQYYLTEFRKLYRNDFIRLSETHNELISLRPDNNRSTKGIANAWLNSFEIKEPFRPDPYWLPTGWHWGYGTRIPLRDEHDKLIKHDRFVKPNKNGQPIQITEQLAREEKEKQIIQKIMVRVSYWKKVLQKNDVIRVSQVFIKSQCRARNKHCHVIWNDHDKQTVLRMCDQIDVLFPTEQPPGLPNFKEIIAKMLAA